MKQIVVRESATVAELADLMATGVTAVVRCGFSRLGLLLTVDQGLEFRQIRELAAEFGFTAVRQEPPEPRAS